MKKIFPILYMVLFLLSSCSLFKENSNESNKEALDCNYNDNVLSGCWVVENCLQDREDSMIWRKSIYKFKNDGFIEIRKNTYSDSNCNIIVNDDHFKSIDYRYEMVSEIILNDGVQGWIANITPIEADNFVFGFGVHIDSSERLCTSSYLQFTNYGVTLNPLKNSDMDYSNCLVRYDGS